MTGGFSSSRTAFRRWPPALCVTAVVCQVRALALAVSFFTGHFMRDCPSGDTRTLPVTTDGAVCCGRWYKREGRGGWDGDCKDFAQCALLLLTLPQAARSRGHPRGLSRDHPTRRNAPRSDREPVHVIEDPKGFLKPLAEQGAGDAHGQSLIGSGASGAPTQQAGAVSASAWDIVPQRVQFELSCPLCADLYRVRHAESVYLGPVGF